MNENFGGYWKREQETISREITRIVRSEIYEIFISNSVTYSFLRSDVTLRAIIKLLERITALSTVYFFFSRERNRWKWMISIEQQFKNNYVLSYKNCLLSAKFQFSQPCASSYRNNSFCVTQKPGENCISSESKIPCYRESRRKGCRCSFKRGPLNRK